MPIEKIFQNQSVFLVGGGPSLKGFDWERLRGKNIIAINRAFEVLPWAQVLYWTDPEFYLTQKNEIDEFAGLKVCSKELKQKTTDIHILKGYNGKQLDMREGHICHGNNSGFGALNLAVKLGAKKVMLLGFDGHAQQKQTHWHNGYNKQLNKTVYRRLDKLFKGAVSQLVELNVEVVNLNSESSIRCFPFSTLVQEG